MAQPSQAKVLFRVPGEDDDAIVETLWAESLGNDMYVLDNSPFYAYGVSWRDVVFAPFDEDEKFATFRSVATKSGNRTVRMRFDPPVEPGNVSDQLLQGVVALGCSFEGANPGYMAINVPPAIELETVRQFLIQHDAEWEHADPTYETLFPDDEV